MEWVVLGRPELVCWIPPILSARSGGACGARELPGRGEIGPGNPALAAASQAARRPPLLDFAIDDFAIDQSAVDESHDWVTAILKGAIRLLEVLASGECHCLGVSPCPRDA